MRRSLLFIPLATAAALLLGGCVYYNGMYNAKRLAGSAWKAERDGRTFEANNLWGQVVTRAESLVVRHPDSKYVDEATVLKGIALSRLKQCPEAVEPLGRVSAIEADGRTGEEAALALGRCHMELGDPAGADIAFSRVLESGDANRRREARLLHAQALWRMGRAEDALTALEGLSGPRASEQRLLALGAAGRTAEAKALADTLIARNDSLHIWDSVLTTVGRSSPLAASMLVDHLGSRLKVSPEIRTRWLYQDAERLESADSVRAAARFRQAARSGARTDHGKRATLRLIRQELRRAGAPAQLAGIADSLGRMADPGSSVGHEARLLGRTVAAVRAAADSSGPGTERGDLRLFLAAETARDSLFAPALAAALFHQLADTWPDSPYAPKAMLAAGVLDPGWAEAMRPLLEERYAASPYLAFLRGEDNEGYRQLEDSLRAYIASAARPAAPGVQPDDSGAVRRNPRQPRTGPAPGIAP